MWIVYNKADSAIHGFEVASETEAIEICNENSELTYCYFGKGRR